MALQLVLDVALDGVEACLDPSLQARLVLARSVDQHDWQSKETNVRIERLSELWRWQAYECQRLPP